MIYDCKTTLSFCFEYYSNSKASMYITFSMYILIPGKQIKSILKSTQFKILLKAQGWGE